MKLFYVLFCQKVRGKVVVSYFFDVMSSNLNASFPFSIDNTSLDFHFGHLDFSGRPVLTVHKKNVFSDHSKLFQITYNFSQWSMLQEPLVLSLWFFLFLLGFIIFTKFCQPMQLNNSSSVDSATAEILSKMKEIMDERKIYHQRLHTALAKALKSKSIQVYVAEKRRVEINLAKCQKDMQRLCQEAEDVDKKNNTEVGKKLKELEDVQEKFVKKLIQVHELEVGYRIQKNIHAAQYEQSKPPLESDLAELEEQLESTISELTENL